MEDYNAREYKKVEVKIPTIRELIHSINGISLTEETIDEITKYYAYEMSSLFSYANNAKEAMITMELFTKQGSQWIAGFSVKDLAKQNDPNCLNFHLQNTSQWCYAGCILYDERDGRVSTHH